jgi:FkbH-like protein
LYAYKLVQLISAMLGKSRRVLVLDLDNTVWGGVIGDDGVENIVLGNGNARGEAHLAIQRMALRYKERGVLLCVASKNDEQIALDAFRRHPEMLLKEEDIALFQVNWNDKATNIKAMADALGLGLEAFVFIDDNPVERKLVRDLLPQVATPELPDDQAGWLPIIQAAGYFEQLAFSAEDVQRTDYYRGNAQRKVWASAIPDSGQFLQSLKMAVTVAPFDALGRPRIAQLISKSNQFNLTTRRYSEAEVSALESARDVATFQVRLADMFGDNGMISVVICRTLADAWEIDTWIMSCRVLGRCVEQAVLQVVVGRARAAGARELRGRCVPTARNTLVRDHYEKLGFQKYDERDNGETSWRLLLEDFVIGEVPMEIVNIEPAPESSARGGARTK